jgi:hypothetical protein
MTTKLPPVIRVLHWAWLAGSAALSGHVLRVWLSSEADAWAAVLAALPVVFLAVGLMALRARPALRTNMVLAVTMATLSAWAGEGLLALMPAPAAVAVAPGGEAGPGGGDNAKVRRLAELRRQGVSAYLSTFPKLFRGNALQTPDGPLFPLGGHSRAAIVFCDEGAGLIEYRSDRYGFRNDDRIWDDAAPQLVLVGDSFVQGACVADDQTLAGHMRADGTRVLDLGMAGSGPLAYMAMMREYLRDKRPAQVVWVHFAGNDLEDLSLERLDPVLSRYGEDARFGQDLRSRQGVVDTALEAFIQRNLAEQGDVRVAAGVPVRQKLGRRLLTATVDTLLLRRSRTLLSKAVGGGTLRRGQEDGKQRELFQALEAAMGQGRDLTAAAGAAMTILYLPSAEELLGTRDTVQLEAVRAMARRLGVVFVDAGPALMAGGEPRRMLGGGFGPHYSGEGYGRVAAELRKALPAARPE